MKKPILYIKQCEFYTVLRLKGSVGFCLLQNKDIESVGIVKALRHQSRKAEQIDCFHSARLYSRMAEALS